MNISIQKLSQRFGGTPVLHGIDLEIQDRELFFLLGPSGCGKTTLLRLLAGFYTPDTGEIAFGGQRMNDVPPHRRNAGMVFQNYALWPHMTVEQNVAYGLDVRSTGRDESGRRVREALATVRMESYAQRTPNQLSGGQQQRVALARALVIRPDVLLLDEPLSNLDARLRLEMRDEIRRIHAETRITTVYVTHDQKEALSLADRVAVMREGRIEQVGDPRTIYRQPANRFVADFIGETNWFSGTVQHAAGGTTEVECPLGRFQVATDRVMRSGQPVWLGFRPESVSFEAAASNGTECVLADTCYLGEVEEYRLQAPDGTLFKAFEQNPVERRARGSRIAISIRARDLLLLDR